MPADTPPDPPSEENTEASSLQARLPWLALALLFLCWSAESLFS